MDKIFSKIDDIIEQLSSLKRELQEQEERSSQQDEILFDIVIENRKIIITCDEPGVSVSSIFGDRFRTERNLVVVNYDSEYAHIYYDIIDTVSEYFAGDIVKFRTSSKLLTYDSVQVFSKFIYQELLPTTLIDIVTACPISTKDNVDVFVYPEVRKFLTNYVKYIQFSRVIVEKNRLKLSGNIRINFRYNTVNPQDWIKDAWKNHMIPDIVYSNTDFVDISF